MNVYFFAIHYISLILTSTTASAGLLHEPACMHANVACQLTIGFCNIKQDTSIVREVPCTVFTGGALTGKACASESLNIELSVEATYILAAVKIRLCGVKSEPAMQSQVPSHIPETFRLEPYHRSPSSRLPSRN